MGEDLRCYPCSYPGKYGLESVKWMMSERKLCPDHRKKAEAMIQKNNPAPFNEK